MTETTRVFTVEIVGDFGYHGIKQRGLMNARGFTMRWVRQAPKEGDVWAKTYKRG